MIPCFLKRNYACGSSLPAFASSCLRSQPLHQTLPRRQQTQLLCYTPLMCFVAQRDILEMTVIKITLHMALLHDTSVDLSSVLVTMVLTRRQKYHLSVKETGINPMLLQTCSRPVRSANFQGQGSCPKTRGYKCMESPALLSSKCSGSVVYWISMMSCASEIVLSADRRRPHGQ